MPKSGLPRKKASYPNLADSFRHAQRYLTWRRPRRRIRTKVLGGRLRLLFTATGKRLFRTRLKVVRVIESLPPRPSNTSVPEVTDRNAAVTNHAPGDASEATDVSVEFRSEMAALFAFYAARIGAARRSLNRTTADIIIMAILGEQAVAVRALTDRWQAATERRRAEKPERPTASAQRKGDDSRPS